MSTFRKDGVYIKMRDANKEGYYTYDGAGKYKKNKYGFLDKLHDIYYYGKTKEISYSYIFFYSPNNHETKLYIGSIGGELTEILKGFTWQEFREYGMKNYRKDFSYINDKKVKYEDIKGRECFITCERNGIVVIKQYYDINNNTDEPIKDEFHFFQI